LEEIFFENFNISKHNMISVELAKGTMVYLIMNLNTISLPIKARPTKFRPPNPAVPLAWKEKKLQAYTQPYSAEHWK
jgi:hypothetical protein